MADAAAPTRGAAPVETADHVAEAPPDGATTVPFAGGAAEEDAGPAEEDAGADAGGAAPSPAEEGDAANVPEAAPTVEPLPLDEARRRIDPGALTALETHFNGRLARVRQLDNGDQLK